MLKKGISRKILAFALCVLLIAGMVPESILAAEAGTAAQGQSGAENVLAEEGAVGEAVSDNKNAPETGEDAAEERAVSENDPAGETDRKTDEPTEDATELEPAGSGTEEPAGTEDELYVGSTKVTGTGNISGIKGGSASYDAETNTITFTGNVTGFTGTNDVGSGDTAQIYYNPASSVSDPLKIKINNKVTLNSATAYGFFAGKYGSFDIEGDLSIENCTENAVYADKNITLSGNMTLKSTSSALFSSEGDITFKGGNISAESTKDGDPAVWIYDPGSWGG